MAKRRMTSGAGSCLDYSQTLSFSDGGQGKGKSELDFEYSLINKIEFLQVEEATTTKRARLKIRKI